MDNVMMLSVSNQVLFRVWCYDFYDKTVSTI